MAARPGRARDPAPGSARRAVGLPPVGRKATIVLVGAAVLGILFFYFGSKPFYFRHLASSFVLGWKQGADRRTLHLRFGVRPSRPDSRLDREVRFREPLSAYGVRLGDLSFGWKAFAVVAPVDGAPEPRRHRGCRSSSPSTRSTGPRRRAARLAGHALAYLAFYAGWEFGFRGFVQFGLREEMGDWNAILVQTALSAALHVGKPFGETLGAVLGGLAWGVIAFRSRSLLVPLLTHWVLGLSLDLFIVCR